MPAQRPGKGFPKRACVQPQKHPYCQTLSLYIAFGLIQYQYAALVKKVSTLG